MVQKDSSTPNYSHEVPLRTLCEGLAEASLRSPWTSALEDVGSKTGNCPQFLPMLLSGRSNEILETSANMLP
jgi:hypothetical protein